MSTSCVYSTAVTTVTELSVTELSVTEFHGNELCGCHIDKFPMNAISSLHLYYFL